MQQRKSQLTRLRMALAKAPEVPKHIGEQLLQRVELGFSIPAHYWMWAQYLLPLREILWNDPDLEWLWPPRRYSVAAKRRAKRRRLALKKRKALERKQERRRIEALVSDEST